MKSGKNLSSGFRAEDNKDFLILNMYIAKGRGRITTRGQNFNCNSFTTLVIRCTLQPLVFSIFSENDFSTFSRYKSMGMQI